MKNLILLSIVLALSACGALRHNAAQEKIDKRTATECPKKEKGQMATYHRCVRTIFIDEAPRDSVFPLTLDSYKVVIGLAEKYDSGEISKEAYDNGISDVYAEYESQIGTLNVQQSQQSQENSQRLGEAIGEAFKQPIIPTQKTYTTDCKNTQWGVKCESY